MTEMPDPNTFVNEGTPDHPRTTQGQEPGNAPGLIAILNAVRGARLGKAMVKEHAVSAANRKAVLLVLATYADRSGGSIYPPMSAISAEAEVGERVAQRAVQSLVRDGVLVVVVASTPHSATRYRIDLDRLAALTPARGAPRAPRDGSKRGVPRAPLNGSGVSHGHLRGAPGTPVGCPTGTLSNHSTYPETPDARAGAREGAGFDMHTSGAQSAASEPPTDGTPVESVPETEPVRLVAGQLVLSDIHRTYWLGPNLYAGDTVALDLALMQAAASMQPRGSHSLEVQVGRHLARIAQQRRDQDRRYREARAASGGPSAKGAPASSRSGAVPGHTSAGRLDPAPPRELSKRYDRGTPQFEAYLASLRADGLHEDADRMERKGDCYLRPSMAQRHMTRHCTGTAPMAGITGALIARTDILRRGHLREPGHA